MENERLNNFVISHSMTAHPLVRAKKKTKIRYYATLDYFVHKFVSDEEYANARLLQYYRILVGNEVMVAVNNENSDDIVCSIVNECFWSRPWRRKYCFWLMCDIALITADKNAIAKTQETIVGYLNKRQAATLGMLVDALFADDEIPQNLFFAESLIHQFRINCKFVAQPEMRILITANMSAGKSTLINALIGKRVVRTAQEACTTNLCYLFNKPFEDHLVHLLASPLNLNASYADLISVERANISYISSYFRVLVQPKARICFIDTPGVNSAMNRDHGKLTRKALVDEKYDKLIYVLNANRLGTDEEFRYLKYISENMPKDKVIFVLNKLDDFKSADDSIAASINGVRNDLFQLGYEKPVICPLSAYFALLLKMKRNGETLSEDEQDAYDLYIKKFSKAEYDLSTYFNEAIEPIQLSEDELAVFALKCGLYDLENVLYGGMNK